MSIKAIYGFSKEFAAFKDKTDLQIITHLKTYGINAIFGGYKDKKWRELCGIHGIKVFAELGLFVGQEYWDNHPESRPINAQGKPIEKIEWYAGVCPNQQWLWDEKLMQMENLIKDDKVDGVWLDFIRYPCHWEVKEPLLEQTCFCPVCLALFQKDRGIKIPERLTTTREKAAWILKNKEQAFVDWKNERIVAFVKQANEVAKKANPEVLVGLFAVPWQKGDVNDAIHKIIAQDFEKLAPYVDVFSPMVYHKMCYKPVNWVGEVTEYMYQKTREIVIPIIQACSVPDKLSDAEFKEALKAAMDSPHSSGVIIFNLKHVLSENRFDSLL